jgi:amidase
LTERTVADIVAYNKQDSLAKIPYGQGRFEKILDNNLSAEELAKLRMKLHDARR